MAKSGLLDYIISPTAGKQPYAACLLHLLGRYNVYSAYIIFYFEFSGHQMQSIGININRLVGGGAPQSLLIGNATCKGSNSTQERSFKCKGSGTPVCTSNISRGTDE